MRHRLLGSAVAALSAAFAAASEPPSPTIGPPDSPPAITAAAPPTPLPIPVPPANPTAESPAPGTQPPAFLPEPGPIPPRTILQPAPVAPVQTQPPMGAGSGNSGQPVAPPPTMAGPQGTPGTGMGGQPAAPPRVRDPGPWNTVWVRGGYALLWIKDAPVTAPLAATGPLGPGQRLLLGGNDVGYSGFNGVTLDAGMWLGDNHRLGIGLSGFLTDQQSRVSSIGSNAAGVPAIARPFFNPLQVGVGGQDALAVSTPGAFAGSIAVETGARLAGFEVNGLVSLANTANCSLVGQFGFRYFDLDEYLTVYQVTRSLNGANIPFFGKAPVAGVSITDRFRTRNQFYGGQAGLEGEYRFGPVFLDVGAKLGLGPVHQVTQVNGTTVGPNGTGGPGGLLAVSLPGTPGSFPNGNLGNSSTSRFALLSDIHTMFGVQLSDRFRIGIGYQFLYLNSVARPGRQIVTTIDPRLVPTSASYGARVPSSTPLGGPGTPPGTPFDRDDFFAHGVLFLVDFRY